jgi:solute carrier family 25 phosphate transporter 3
VDPNLSDKTFLTAAREIMKNEGMSALWAGLGPTGWGYLFEGAIKFGVYEALKPVVKSSLSRAAAVTSHTILNSQILAFLLCAAASGLAASFILTPMEALRIRLVSEPNFAPGGWLEGGRKMLKQEGFSGLAKGVNPMIMKQVPYTVTKNVSFDIIAGFFYSVMRAQGIAFTAASTFTVPLLSAVIASVLACISSQPGDMVLSLVNAHEGDQR